MCIYVFDMCAVVKKDEGLMSRTEMRWLRWRLGVSRIQRIKDEEIRRRCGTAGIVEKVREARLRWVGQVLRREKEEPCRVAMEYEEGNRSRGRLNMRWREYVKRDIELRGLKEDAQDRGRWTKGTQTADLRVVWDSADSK